MNMDRDSYVLDLEELGKVAGEDTKEERLAFFDDFEKTRFTEKQLLSVITVLRFAKTMGYEREEILDDSMKSDYTDLLTKYWGNVGTM